MKPGEVIPAPIRRHVVTEEASYAFMDWRNPNWRDKPYSPYHVILVRTSEPNLAAPGDRVAVTIEGSDPGELYDGKLPGEASVYWVIPNVTACSTVAIWFSAPDATRKQARREAKTIAESLRPAG